MTSKIATKVINIIKDRINRINLLKFNTDDVTTLLLQIRSHTPAKSFIRDLCTHVSHPEGLNDGKLFEYVRSFILHTKVQLWLGDKNNNVDIHSIPRFVYDHVLLCIETFDKKKFKHQTGFSTVMAKEVFFGRNIKDSTGILKKSNNECYIESFTDSKIKNLFTFILTKYIPKPLMISTFIEELSDILLKINSSFALSNDAKLLLEQYILLILYDSYYHNGNLVIESQIKLSINDGLLVIVPMFSGLDDFQHPQKSQVFFRGLPIILSNVSKNQCTERAIKSIDEIHSQTVFIVANQLLDINE